MSDEIFVTGGSGFVGRHLIQALRKRGYRVCELARSSRAQSIVEAQGTVGYSAAEAK